MTNKIISVATLLCMLAVVLLSKISPADPLFSFFSPDPAISGFRLSLVAVMLLVAFKNCVSNDFLRRGLAGAGLGLIAFGIFNIFNPYSSSLFFNYLMPLDHLLIIETGVVLALVAFDKQIKPKYEDTKPTKVPVRAAA